MAKKEKLLLLFVYIVITGLILGWSYTYDITTPADSDNPAEADDRMREIKAALQERLAVEHVFALTGNEVSGANTGKHTDITCYSVTSTGAISGTTITGTGAISGTDITGTGNATIGGTLGVTGVATVAKGSLLASSDAPTTDAMIANKKYVDDQISAALASYVTLSAPTNEDSEGNALLKSHAYLAATDGEVSAFVQMTIASHALRGYVGNTNDPAGAGTKMQEQDMGNTVYHNSIFLTVAKGEYFEITASSGTPTILWRSRGTLSKPIDQD